MLYDQVGAEATRLRTRLSTVLADRGEGPEALLHREVTVDATRQRLTTLGAAESGLCFGAMTADNGEKTYLGRIGVFDDEQPHPLLLDWRAPAARPFYCATSRTPMGISGRRHFQCSRHRIVDISDEFLDADHAVDAALTAALDAPRTAAMRDIVGTIQADQDAIIRDRPSGILVIDGGPGTGKTSVALHRIAYLLYAEAERLTRRGVLMVGPNTRFLRYVSRVLPSLGETGVAFCTPGELYPGLATTATEPAATRRVKGSAAMVDVLRTAVADRQELPAEPIRVPLDDITVHLDADIAAAARDRARAAGLLHNQARSVFLRTVVDRLTEAAVTAIGADLLEPADLLDVANEVTAAPALAAAADLLWPRLTPQRLLGELYTAPERIAAATPGWSETDRALLHRADPTAWTEADAALLDEAEELLGTLPPVPPAAPEPEHGIPDDLPDDPRDEVEYAKGVLQILDLEVADDGEEQIRVTDLLEAGALAQRQEVRDTRSIAERALADRTWTFGHIVVDEAQELSPMQWRVLHRRCPVRSMTVAGDLAQGAAGTAAWDDVFAPGTWRPRTLRTNYRVPAPVMALAVAAAPGVTPPDSPRDAEKPWRAAPGDLDALVDAELTAVHPGLVAVIAEDPPPLTPREGLSVLTPTEAKGLEFDAVIVLEPQRIALAADRYVALTRATRRLGLVHTEPLPAPWEQHTVPR